MPSERHKLPPPRERTFAELFPWRNIRLAVMLVLLILAIVVLKRSAGSLLVRAGDLWGPPGSSSPSSPSVPRPAAVNAAAAIPPTGAPVGTPRGVSGGDTGVRIRLGPGLAPAIPAADVRSP